MRGADAIGDLPKALMRLTAVYMLADEARKRCAELMAGGAHG
jgi:hypothetical protein